MTIKIIRMKAEVIEDYMKADRSSKNTVHTVLLTGARGLGFMLMLGCTTGPGGT